MILIIKPTQNCNGNCDYCAAAGLSNKEDKQPMLLSTFQNLLNKAAAYLVSSTKEESNEPLTFLWHGGEPLMMELSFYQQVQSLTNEIKNTKQIPIHHTMQSNITLLSDDNIKFIRSFLDHSHISSSFDPIGETRKLKGGRDYRKYWLQSYFFAKAHGLEVSLVYVAHRGSLGKEEQIYYTLKNLGIQNVTVNPVYISGMAREDIGKNTFLITPEEWGEFLFRLYQIYEEDDCSLSIDPITPWINKLEGHSQRLSCSYNGQCPFRFFGVDHQGNMYNCGRFLDDHILPLGNINHPEVDFPSLMQKKQSLGLMDRTEHLLNNECQQCFLWEYCHGGCPHHSYIYYETLKHKTYWCKGYQVLFEKLKQRFTTTLKG